MSGEIGRHEVPGKLPRENLRRQGTPPLGKNSVVIRPVEVTEVEELEDEGPGYFVKADDDTWIFFSGQEMLSPKRRGFPWSEFGAVEAPHSGVFFGLKRMGDSIPVERTIPPLPYELARDLGAFQRTLVLLDDDARALIDADAGMQGLVD